VQVWRSSGAPDFRVTVNRSPLQFLRDAHGTHRCLLQLQALGLPPEAVAIELTEGVLIDSPERVEGHLRALRQAGVALCLDDFGTGYSSLSRLHDFELDVLKIDRAFVMHLSPNSKELHLCRGIIQLAQALGLKVVAEGVETDEQRDILKDLGCDAGQGWLFGRPLSPAALGERLQLAARPQVAR
jgi:EAL domain-containing protein (putative c-di-GMP-specific phosphodiesterase class I)